MTWLEKINWANMLMRWKERNEIDKARWRSTRLTTTTWWMNVLVSKKNNIKRNNNNNDNNDNDNNNNRINLIIWWFISIVLRTIKFWKMFKK